MCPWETSPAEQGEVLSGESGPTQSFHGLSGKKLSSVCDDQTSRQTRANTAWLLSAPPHYGARDQGLCPVGPLPALAPGCGSTNTHCVADSVGKEPAGSRGFSANVKLSRIIPTAPARQLPASRASSRQAHLSTSAVTRRETETRVQPVPEGTRQEQRAEQPG